MRRAVAVAAGAWALLVGGLAHADAPDQIATARALGTEGVLLAEGGRCVEAIDRLTHAEALHHAPTTLERLGECQVAIGKVALGTETLRRVVREALPAHAPAPFVAAQERARDALEKAAALVGNLRVHITFPEPAGLTVSVDDTPFATAVDVVRPIDPGSHTVHVNAAGYEPEQTNVAVRAGETKEIEITLRPSVTAQPTSVATTHGPSRTPAWVAFGAGAAGLAVGGIFGALALSSKATLDAECAGFNCPAAQQSNIGALSRDSWIANAGFGVAIAGAAFGAVWLLTRGSSSSAVVGVGAGSASVQGRF